MFRNSFVVSVVAIAALALGGCAAGVTDEVSDGSDSPSGSALAEGANAKIRHDGKLADTVSEGALDNVKFQRNAAMGADVDAKRVAKLEAQQALIVKHAAKAAMGTDIDMKLNPGATSVGAGVDMKLNPGATSVGADIDMKLTPGTPAIGENGVQIDEVGRVIYETGGDFKMKAQETSPSRPEIEEGVDGFK